MKTLKTLLLVITFTFLSCTSEDDCYGNSLEINEFYNQQINLANGDQRIINLIIQEQLLALSNSCD